MMYLEELIECIVVGEHCNNESINVKSSWCSVDCLGGNSKAKALNSKKEMLVFVCGLFGFHSTNLGGPSSVSIVKNSTMKTK